MFLMAIIMYIPVYLDIILSLYKDPSIISVFQTFCKAPRDNLDYEMLYK